MIDIEPCSSYDLLTHSRNFRADLTACGCGKANSGNITDKT